MATSHCCPVVRQQSGWPSRKEKRREEKENKKRKGNTLSNGARSSLCHQRTDIAPKHWDRPPVNDTGQSALSTARTLPAEEDEVKLCRPLSFRAALSGQDEDTFDDANRSARMTFWGTGVVYSCLWAVQSAEILGSSPDSDRDGNLKEREREVESIS